MQAFKLISNILSIDIFFIIFFSFDIEDFSIF